MELELASPSVKRVKIKIYDVSGKALITTTRTIRRGLNAIKLDISNLPSGEYFVCIRTASNKYVKRFIVMR
ncbi:MAG TPA: T9SS type A sorting domain-containing protein [candidate division WOR-3 bacterium]|uniref:T9SS type A sorting domain-containing protein n=1 Tax=candidate division WOR-3 bacterium TaxID=2052148 RepID=A0A7C0XB71_UNCW3|nr:T9SS type A sorting domain-containing protein [candidate division WOR-3 bacterium]